MTTPTHHLRLVQRLALCDAVIDPDTIPLVNVLQQWWRYEPGDRADIRANGGEWLDVPIEPENNISPEAY